MAQSSRTIGQLLAYSMLPIWVVAILMLLIVIALAQVPEAGRIEEQRMKENLQRVFQAVQGDVDAIKAFTHDWGMWDETNQFLAKPNRDYIDTNLLIDTQMQDFEIDVLSFLNLQEQEIWTRTTFPDTEVELTHRPYFLDELTQHLLKESRQQGMSALSGVLSSQWGPLIFSLQPVTDSAGVAKPNGFLLAIRWLDRRYMVDLAERTALPINVSLPKSSNDLLSFKQSQARMNYHMDLGLYRIRGEGLLLDNHDKPVLTLLVEQERDVLQGALIGSLWMLLGMLAISLFCILIARQRLRVIVLEPVSELVTALQHFSEHPDVSVLPIFDSSREMAVLSRKFREMAAKISLQHSAMQAHSSRLEMAAYTDPLTQAFNRRYLAEWLLARYELVEPRLAVMLDLDHFKRVNDDYGHDMGDLVLRQLAELLRCHIGEREPLIRLGGEEFLLLLLQQDAVARIERLRRDIAEFRFGREGAPLRLTVSLGYCSYPLHRELEDSFWDLSFKLTDIALYRAKQEGRDRWQGFSGELPREWWSSSHEQIIASGVLNYQTSSPAEGTSAAEPATPAR